MIYHYTVLRWIQQRARPRTYLEIGVDEGSSFALATSARRAVGVDPEPRLVHSLPPNGVIFAETSDEFFGRPEIAEILGTVDVAFIDGLHLYEQALRDFVNLEPHMAAEGVVLLHDVLPPDPAWATRDERPGAWTGDVWKVVPILRRHRPDLTVEVIDVLCGLAIVTGLDPGDRSLANRFAEVVAEFADVAYAPVSAGVAPTWAELSRRVPTYQRAGTGVWIRLQRDRARWLTRSLRRRFGALRST
ncbi:MAG: class I SAM-dependent methyltransferase [Actinomycetes bacterium]